MTKKKEEEIIVDITDELDGLTLEEKIDKLGQEILANAFVVIKRIKKNGKKSSEREIAIQEEMQRQFKYIQSTYSSLMKMNRVGSSPNAQNFDRELMERVKQKSSSLGSIVTKVPK